MKDILLDVIKYTSDLNKMDHFVVEGTSTETFVGAVDVDQVLYVKGRLKQAIPEFEGKFAVGNVKLLKGLLTFDPYFVEGGGFKVVRHVRNDVEAPDQFEIGNDRTGRAIFKMKNLANNVREPGNIKKIPWDVDFIPDPAKIASFQKLCAMFSSAGKKFSTATDGKAFKATLGTVTSSTDSASMVLSDDVTGTLRGEQYYDSDQFFALVKLAGGEPAKLSWSSRGIMGMTLESEFATYDYYLRAYR